MNLPSLVAFLRDLAHAAYDFASRKPCARMRFDAHVSAALDVANPGWREARAAFDAADAHWECTCADAVWTDAELVEYAPDLAVLDAVTTYDDFVYLTGGDQ